ncbi:MAG: hypothetical protein C0448_15830 [Sphingobacteriaceae bacterium]|nr:hypothetical protein [Sphingobacteriaceae bacterium]
MKKLYTLIAVCFAVLVNAQIVSFNPRTGDLDMDNVLKDINTKAQTDIKAFKDQVSTKFNLAKDKVQGLLNVMAPGDVFMVAQTAEITHKPVETVADTYKKNKDKGWGAIAKELGIKPGSKEFHELKNKTKEHKGKSKDKGKPEGKGKTEKPKGKKK